MGKSNRHANTNILYMLCDILYGLIAYLVSVMIYGRGEAFNNIHYFEMCACFIVIMIISNENKRLYNTMLFFYVDRILAYITKSFVFTSLIVTALAFVVGTTDIEIKYFIIFLVSEYVAFIASAFITRKLARKTGFQALRTIFVGSKYRYEKVVHFLKRNNMGVEFVGYVNEEEVGKTLPDDTEYIGTLSNLESIIHRNGIDQVFFIQHLSNPVNLNEYVELCMTIGVTVRMLSHPYQAGRVQNYVSSIGTYPMITYHNVSLDAYSKLIKRLFDMVASFIGIVLSSPIMLITAIAIKIEDPEGPVLFKQVRVGQNGRHFKMLKFRSMCVDAEKKKCQFEENNTMKGPMFKIDNDPRITKVGRFIRKTSIDELPQFFNVLTGTMSLVGTRPPTLDEVERYEKTHWRRLSIKPGITGMWQVSGRSQIKDFEDVVALDTEYIDKWSIWLDIKILFKTVLNVIIKRGDAM